jgi:hypothetical protein
MTKRSHIYGGTIFTLDSTRKGGTIWFLHGAIEKFNHGLKNISVKVKPETKGK